MPSEFKVKLSGSTAPVTSPAPTVAKRSAGKSLLNAPSTMLSALRKRMTPDKSMAGRVDLTSRLQEGRKQLPDDAWQAGHEHPATGAELLEMEAEREAAKALEVFKEEMEAAVREASQHAIVAIRQAAEGQ